MELRVTGASSVLPDQAQQLPAGAVAGVMSSTEEVGKRLMNTVEMETSFWECVIILMFW